MNENVSSPAVTAGSLEHLKKTGKVGTDLNEGDIWEKLSLIDSMLALPACFDLSWS